LGTRFACSAGAPLLAKAVLHLDNHANTHCVPRPRGNTGAPSGVAAMQRHFSVLSEVVAAIAAD
jgi:hypothetical protein